MDVASDRQVTNSARRDGVLMRGDHYLVQIATTRTVRRILSSSQLSGRIPQLPRKILGASAIMCEMMVGLRRSMSTAVKYMPPLTSSPQYLRSQKVVTVSGRDRGDVSRVR